MKHIRKFNESENITDSDMINLKKYKDELEEAAENYAIDKQNDTGSKYYIALESFIAGAEWYKNSIEHKHTSDDQRSERD